MSTTKLACALLLSILPLYGLASEEIYGTWRLVSFTRNVVATGEKIDFFGKAPKGVISYSRDGRMYAILVKDERPSPRDMAKVSNEERLELFNTMAAYAGTFAVDGKTVTHHVDVSWNGNWTGTAQKRNFRIDGRKLFIETDPQASGVDGKHVVLVLEWEKVTAP